jgi:hypothetical protein
MNGKGLLVVLLFSIALAASAAFAQTVADAPAPVTPLHGIAPVAGGGKVPLAWLPPGALDPDTGPSAVIYPPQSLTIRFNHKLHVAQGATCLTCHGRAKSSVSSHDGLLPKPTLCDGCHGTDHKNLNAVAAGDDAMGSCGFCHLGWKAEDGNRVARLVIPPPNLVFNHKAHADRNIGCGQCHGAVEALELATRDQLPRMRGCFRCHAMTDAEARGGAASACETCHIKNGSGAGGSIRTVFASGVLYPPRWLRNAAHDPDFIERHKYVAGNDSQFCATCHREDFCVACHDGRVRPRTIHPNDYISMHGVEARLAMQRCTSCHREQSFCVTCHMRVGVTMSGPADLRTSGRFHPPKEVWSALPRKPGHHAFEAQRNLDACVSCHIERDCVACHGGAGIGAGFNPHPPGFASRCAAPMRRNPRPCLACHQPDDGVLAECR